jgi:hypothetical protein
MKTWAQLPAQANLPAPITLAGAASSGPFIFLVGGYDTAGKTSLNTVYRAEVLQPVEAPQINDADLAPDPTDGLAPGLYFYRVAAVVKKSDPVNPGGETLASDEFAINVPAFQDNKIQVTIAWNPGPTSVDHWRVYRTSAPGKMPGGEDVVFVTADASSSQFVDKGATMTPFAPGTPQPFGALGVWAAQPALGLHRAGLGVAIVTDPSMSTKSYLYAGLGYDSTTSSFPATYELLNVDTASHAPTGMWSTPANVNNGAAQDVGRWLAGAYAVTADVDSEACPAGGACQAYVFFGPGATSVGQGATASNGAGETDIARVTPGTGVLAFGAAGTGNKIYGYGAVTATNWIFQIGGASGGGATDKVNASAIHAAASVTGTPTMDPSYGPQGTGVLGGPRFLPGVTFGPPFFYTVGGTDTVGGAAKADTFYNVF